MNCCGDNSEEEAWNLGQASLASVVSLPDWPVTRGSSSVGRGVDGNHDKVRVHGNHYQHPARVNPEPVRRHDWRGYPDKLARAGLVPHSRFGPEWMCGVVARVEVVNPYRFA